MSITFETKGLLSRYGFMDGQLLDDLLMEEFGTSNNNDLAEVVIRCVIPKIDQKIEIEDIVDYISYTSHNPIRAERIDGISVDDFDSELTPRFVEVEEKDIIEVLKEVI